ncbi:MAG: nucleoside deaminase [Erysipelotrichaceae bacterium]|nr:nucleoside deaminase [Erysipelotrichaceae bacterium]
MDIKYMELALLEAKKAYQEDEIPVGCIIVKDDVILAKAHNIKEKKNSVLGHAEIECIKKACKKINNWNLSGCDLYVTLEPCLMCTGAIVNARIDNVYFSSRSEKGGSLVSSLNIKDVKKLNHYPKIHEGLLSEQTSALLKDYFKTKREK